MDQIDVKTLDQFSIRSTFLVSVRFNLRLLSRDFDTFKGLHLFKTPRNSLGNNNQEVKRVKQVAKQDIERNSLEKDQDCFLGIIFSLTRFVRSGMNLHSEVAMSKF